MKRTKFFFVAFAACLISIFAKAQNDTINYPLPDFVNSFYAIVNSQPVAIEKQEASVKAKQRIGSFITTFAAGTKSYTIIRGAKSTTRLPHGTVTFIYEPSVMADPSQTVKIVKLESNERKNERSIQTGKSSLYRAKANELVSVPFTYKKYKEKCIILNIQNIEPGEYGILLTGSDNSAISNIQYQLFGID